MPSALGTWSLNQWTTRKVPRVNIFKAKLQNGSITALEKFLSDETCIFTYIDDNSEADTLLQLLSPNIKSKRIF